MGVVRVATIGSSAIAERFLDAVGQVEGVEYVAAYSRTLDRAHAFGAPHGASLFLDRLDELAASDAVDAVYIASPNGVHAAQASLLARAGKHVLVEKSFAPTEREARGVFDAAREGGVVALEATRNLHTQGFATIERTLPRLGTITQASLRFGKVTSRIARLEAGEYVGQLDPMMGEGALTDIGVYCVEPAVALFGVPDSVSASLVTRHVPWRTTEPLTTMDVAGSIALRYADRVVDLSFSKVGDDLAPSQVIGQEGTLLIPTINCPRDLTLVLHEDAGMAYGTVGGTEEALVSSVPENDMVCEVATFRDAILGVGDASTRVRRCERVTLASLAIMDEARRQAGVRFPGDE